MKITNIIVKHFMYMKPSDMLIADGHEIVIVEVETDAGITGMSFVGAPVYPHGQVGDIVGRLIERNLKNIIIGENPLHTETIWKKMYEGPWRIGMRGMIKDCIAAIDIALWDIKAKALGVPAADLFGGNRKRILTYANVSQQRPPKEMGEQAAKYVEAGHTAVKIRADLPAISLKEATERVAAVRDAIGPDTKLLVDTVGTWDVDTAIEMLKKWEKYDIYWLEEPVPAEDIEGYARIRERAGNTNIVGGEQNANFNDFKQFIEKKAVDIIQPNAQCVGGITNWLKIYHFATSNNVPIAPWNLQQIHVPLAIGLENVKWIEYFTPDRGTFQNTLLEGPVFKEEKHEDGIYLVGSNEPGFGLKINEEIAEKTLVKEMSF